MAGQDDDLDESSESDVGAIVDAEQVEEWNEEDAQDLERPSSDHQYNVTIAARDWTVETVAQQIRQGNIDLDPSFQRRNAWGDQRRSRLIESFILNFPVPQIVLAENPHKKKTFVVIDGKQRLMTVAGLYLENYRGYWYQSRFVGLSVLKHLNQVALDDFLLDPNYEDERRQLANADIRTTIIAGFRDENVLYDIFYRINTGSVPLSSQELRQVLNQGPFAQYLIRITSTSNPLWKVLRIQVPDPRLRDVELLLRLVAWRRYYKPYVGNMKPFLDNTMKGLNEEWNKESGVVEELVSEIMKGIEAVHELFGIDAGRKYRSGKFERSLNRVLFEVQVYYFSFPEIRERAYQRRTSFLEGFKNLSSDSAFTSSIESTTKSIENYVLRFDKYRGMLAKVLDIEKPPVLPLGDSKRP